MTVSTICSQSWKEWTGGDPQRRYDLFCRLEPGHHGDHTWLSHVTVLAGDDLDPPAWVSSRYRRPVRAR